MLSEFTGRRRRFAVFVLLSAFVCARPASAQYTRRFTTIDNGAITFTGNALGLDGEPGQNGQGTRGSIATFITTDLAQQDTAPPPATAPQFPAGTTSDWRLNRSAAVLRLPSGARVLRAELVWGGTFAGNTAADNVSSFINNPVLFTTPAGTSEVSPDPTTGKIDGTLAGTGTCNGCFYVRTADVTALVAAAGPGTYAAGRVPATQGTTDNNNPSAGWTLAVVYEDFNQPIRNLSLFLGLEESGGAAASVSGFCTPPSGPVSGRLAVSAMEGDARVTGDKMLFGAKAPLADTDRVQGPRNPVNNFFSGQITDDTGVLDTAGTFGDRNHTPDAPVAGGRQGWDITNVNVSSQLRNNQTAALAQGTTTGDGYRITTLALQIDVGAPRFQSAGAMSVDRAAAQVGDVLTYTVRIDNTGGNTNANNAVLTDALAAGTSYVAGSFTVNGVAQPGANPVAGVPLGTLAAGTVTTITFQARVDGVPPGPNANLRVNTARWTFDFVSCAGQPAQTGAGEGSAVTDVPAADLVMVKDFQGPVVIAGAEVAYQLTVGNNGPSPVSGAVVTDPGSTPGLTNVTWTCTPPIGGSCSPTSGTGPISSTISQLPGTSVTFRALGTLPPNTPAGTISNTATVTSPPGIPDPSPANNTATRTAQIIRRADLEVVKTGPATGSRGANVTYSIVVRNLGPSDTENVVVTDPPPTGLTLVSLTGPCTSAPGCALAAGASATATATFAIPPGYAGPDPIVNAANATSNSVTDANPRNNTGVARTSLDAPVVDLALTKTNGVNLVTAGSTTTYTITVTNAGPASAVGSRVVDRFDPAMFASVQWQCAASGTSTCTVSGPRSGDIDTLINVDPGAGNAVVLTAQALVLSTLHGRTGTPPGTETTPETLTNSATVTAAAGVGEANESDNTATDTDPVTVLADLSIVKTGPATIVAGTTVEYTVVVNNAGPSSVRDFVFVDTPLEGTDFTGVPRPELVTSIEAPAGTSCTVTSEFSGFGALPICTIPLIEPGGSRVFTVRMDVPPDFHVSAGSPALSNVADTISGAFDEDPDLDDLTAITTATLIARADVGVTKIGPAVVVAGSQVSYFIRSANAGPSTATNVVVDDPIPPGLTLVGGNGVCASGFPCTIPSLGPGEGSTTRIDLQVPIDYAGPPTFVNTASVHSDVPDSTTTNNSASVSTLVVPDHADVGVTLTAPTSVPARGVMTVSARVTNFGPGRAFNVTLSGSLPAGTRVVGRSIPPGLTCSAPTLGVTNLSICVMPVLEPGQFIDVSRTLQLDPSVAAGSILTDLVTVSSTTPGHNPTNNQAVGTTRVTDAVEAGVFIETIDSPDPVVAGANVTYTLTVGNRGPAAATSVTVIDTLPAGMTLVTATSSQGTCAGTTCSLGTIAASGTATVTIVATTSTVGVFTNTASVTAAEPDPILTNNAARQTTTVATADQADLLIQKIGPTLEAPGDTTFYTITVTNRGPARASTVQVSDTLPAGLTFVGNSGACSTPFPCEFDALEPGQSVVIFTAFTIDPGLATPTTVVNTATVSSSVVSDPDPTNNVGAVTTAIDAAQNADLVVTKVDSPDAVVAGTTLSYAVAVLNRGPGPAPDVVMTDVMPAGVTLISATHSGGDCSGTTTITCSIGTMPPGTVVLIGILAAVSPDATSLSNTASAISSAFDPDPGNNSRTEPTTVLPPIADLAITKILTTPAIPGLPARYSIVVTNRGPSAVAGGMVTDAFPPAFGGVSWLCAASAGSACGAASGTGGIATTVDLASGGIATFTVTGTIAASAIGDLTNIATVTATGVTDPDTTNNAAASTAPLTPQADLQISKSGPVRATAGTSVGYTISVTNAGPSDARDVTLADPAPAGLGFVSGGGACAAYPCSLGVVAAGQTVTASATFSIPAGYTTPDPIANTATVSSATTPDPSAGNNTATATTSIAAPVTDLSITKTNGVTTAIPGTTTTYTITVTNAGPSNAIGATVTDTFTAAITGVTWTCASAAGGSCSTAAGSGHINTTVNIPLGGTAVFTASGTVALDAVGVLVNSASVTPGPGASDPSSANNTDADSITPQADVAITKTGPASVVAGHSLVYTLTVTNQGPSNAEHVSVDDPAQTGTAFVSNAGDCTTTFPCDLGTLPAGASRTITATFTPSGDVLTSPIVNTATVSSTTSDPDAANNSASFETSVNRDADLEITTSIPAGVKVGDSITVAVTVVNHGPNAANDVVVTDNLPAGLQFVSAAPGQGAYDESTGTWIVGALAAGATTTLDIVATVTAPGTFTNLAVKTGEAEPDPITANDSAAATTSAVPAADVAVEKTADRSDALVGDSVAFTVKVTNRGPSPATGLAIADTLPAGLTLVSASPSVGAFDPAGGRWTIAALAVNAEAVLTLTTTVNAPGALANTAATAAQDQIDPNPVNNTAAVSINAAPDADLSVTKAVSDPAPAVGALVTYTIAVTNFGPSDAASAEVLDALPGGLSFVSAAASDGTYDPASGVWTLGAIPVGRTQILSIAARVTATGALANRAARQASTPVDPNPANDGALSAATSSVVADLQIAKTPTVSAALAGGPATWTIVVTNRGPSDISGAQVADLLPPGLGNVQWTCTASSGSACGAPTGAGAVNAAVNLLANGTAAFIVTGAINSAAAGPIDSVAAVTAPAGTTDPDLSNNTATGPILVSALPPQSADLAIAKSGPAAAAPGSTPTYTLTITNAGPAAADGVVVNDPAPAGTAFVSASAPCAGGFPCALGSMAPGTSASITVTLKVLPSAASARSITNTAVVSATTPDALTSNNSATATTAIRRASGCDVDGDGVDEIVTGAGPGGGPHVRVFKLNGTAPVELASFYAYDPAFPFGVYVACGDVDGDGLADVITGAGGGAPVVRAFSLAGGTVAPIASFTAYDAPFAGGVRVAAGDVNGDGVADIVTGAGPGGGPHVRIFSLRGGTPLELASFYAYDPGYAGGVFVAAGDVDGDGKAEVVTGTPRAGGPVRVFAIGGPAGVTEAASWFPYFAAFAGPVRVAAADIDGDGRADVITGAGPGGGPHVRAFSLASGSPSELASFYAYDPSWCDIGGVVEAIACEGVFVAGADLNGDGRAEIITGTNHAGGPVRVFTVGSQGVAELTSFFAYFDLFRGPVRVASTHRPAPATVTALHDADEAPRRSVRCYRNWMCRTDWEITNTR